MAAEVPIRSISITEDQLRLLEKDVWSDRFVKAVMTVNGKQSDIQLRYRGGHTREYPKHSYEVVRGGKTYHYNAEYDDPSMIRNALSFCFFEWIGVPAPKTKHCLLYMNGRMLGVYLEIEGVERAFFRKRGIAVQSLFYASNDLANFSLYSSESKRRKESLFSGYKQIIGTSDERSALVDFIRRLNTDPAGSKKQARYFQRHLDIDNYLRWLAGAVLTGNYDGFEHNYSIYRHKPSQKYRMIPWDYEGTWGRNCYGKPCAIDLVDIMGYNKLTRRLLRYKSAREHYKMLLADMLSTHFTVGTIMPVAMAMHRAIRPYIYHDWNRKWAFSVFDREPQYIAGYVDARRQVIAGEMRKL